MAWGRVTARTIGLFLQVFDIVLEDEKVGPAVASHADERQVVVFDHSDHFLAIYHFHPDERGVLDQLLEILRLFECLFRGARRFAAVCRIHFSASP
jgi:hypothetical protein